MSAPRFRVDRNSGQQITKQLQAFYGRLAGELHWIENPPKLRQLAWRGGEEFAATAGERESRAEKLREALPHFAYVIQHFDPAWRPEMAKLVRPIHRRAGSGPPHGWTEAAFDVLRRADDFMTVREIIGIIADRYDIEIEEGPDYVQVYNAASINLMENYRTDLVSDDRQPPGWALRSRLGAISKINGGD